LLAGLLAVLSAVMLGAAAIVGGRCERKRCCIVCKRRDAFGAGLLCLECREGMLGERPPRKGGL
jgi:hypothetical protein